MSNLLFALQIILVIFLFINTPVKAELFINEFASNDEIDWVEVYNTGPETVDMSLYQIRDESATNHKNFLGELAVNGFITVDFNNWLNNSGDSVKLVLISNGNVVDSVTYGSSGSVSALAVGQSGGRFHDGSNNWVVFSSASKGASNNSSVPINIPTSTNMPTSTSTVEPTNSPTPMQTQTTTPTPTRIPTTTSTLTNMPLPTQKSSMVTSTEMISPTDQAMLASATQEAYQKILGLPEEKEVGVDEKDSVENRRMGKYLITAGFLLIGLSLLGLSVYSLSKSEKKQ